MTILEFMAAGGLDPLSDHVMAEYEYAVASGYQFRSPFHGGVFVGRSAQFASRLSANTTDNYLMRTSGSADEDGEMPEN